MMRGEYFRVQHGYARGRGLLEVHYLIRVEGLLGGGIPVVNKHVMRGLLVKWPLNFSWGCPRISFLLDYAHLRIFVQVSR